MNSEGSSNLFSGCDKTTIQVKDEITEINYMINQLKQSHAQGNNTVDEGTGMLILLINSF